MSRDEAFAAAAKGAKLLDFVDPQWFTQESIDTEQLDLASTSVCILGQRYGLYAPGNLARELTRAVARKASSIKTVRLAGLGEVKVKVTPTDTDLQHVFDPQKASDWGFDVSWCVEGRTKRNQAYSHLTEAWVEEINKRREADGQRDKRSNRSRRSAAR